mgnify:CR=1 FL=1
MGLDRLGVSGDRPQLGAQALDVAVDIALVTGIGHHPQRIEQLFTAEYPLGPLQQAVQQTKLVAGVG